MHEYLALQIRSALNLSKIQFYAWVYGIVGVISPVLCLRFLLSLPRRIGFLLVIGGSAFVLGAFGIDLVIAYLGKSIDHDTMAYIGMATFEELMEMGGIIVLVYTLLSYMGSEQESIGVKIAK